MRMRRKKHREERLENCSWYLIEDLISYKNDIKEIFPDNKKQLHIEIGCGKGKFITELAALNPDINYLAFEKNLDVLVLAAEKAKAKELENLKFFAGDVNILSQFETGSKCDRIYINFCDPWKKKGYAKRRLTHSNFLKMYEQVLSQNGEIHFKTDNKGLFEFSLNSFSEYGLKLKNITLDLHASDFEGNIMTEYETLFSEQGNPIYRCEADYLEYNKIKNILKNL